MFLVPAIAVIVILAAVWLLGTREVPGFTTDDAVLALLQAEHPDFAPAELVRSADSRSALVRTDAGATLAIAFVVGNQVTSHLVSPDEVRGVDARVQGGVVDVSVHTHDLGCPVLHLRLPAEAWPRWGPRLEALASEPAAPRVPHVVG